MLTLLNSCSLGQLAVLRNRVASENKMNSFCKRNGNAFLLSSEHAPFSVVWSYHNDEIEICRFNKGRIGLKETFKESISIADFYKLKASLEGEVYRYCPMELDGDKLHVKYIEGNETKDVKIIANINCMKDKAYESQYLQKLVGDIIKYELWEVFFP